MHASQSRYLLKFCAKIVFPFYVYFAIKRKPMSVADLHIGSICCCINTFVYPMCVLCISESGWYLSFIPSRFLVVGQCNYDLHLVVWCHISEICLPWIPGVMLIFSSIQSSNLSGDSSVSIDSTLIGEGFSKKEIQMFNLQSFLFTTSFVLFFLIFVFLFQHLVLLWGILTSSSHNTFLCFFHL